MKIPVRILLEETAGWDRLNEPVSGGIPVPRGIIFDPADLGLWDSRGKRRPLQANVLARWFDGSIKWLLLDFQASVSAYTQTVYELRPAAGEKPTTQTRNVSICETVSQIVIDVGGIAFYINRRICRPFDRIVVNGIDLIDPNGSSLILLDSGGREHCPYADELFIETAGPLRATLRVSGEFKSGSGDVFARFGARLKFHAGTGLVEMTVTLHNPRAARHNGGLWDLGDEGSIYFKDLSLLVPLRGTDIAWRSQPQQARGAYTANPVEIYQDSSGGVNWQSSNHVNRFGKVMHSFRGYRIAAGGKVLEEGLRATPTLTIEGRFGSINATIDKFWQNFPKAIEADKNGLALRLFPRQYNDVFELQGGEQKTHTLYLQFSSSEEQQLDLRWVHDRLVPRTAPEWHSKSKACSYLSPRSQDKNAACQRLIDTAIDGPQSFFARREIIDEYGWRNFGDLYADHEAVGHKGGAPLIAHYNNQYDVVYGALIQYFRGGGSRWFNLASDLARHVIDIDIYHTNEDRPAYNGGLFWHTDHYLDAGTATHRSFSKLSLSKRDRQTYGGGPGNEHNYTSGLLLYYYLTGDETARASVVGLANWVINMDDGSRRFLGWLDRRATGFCSASAGYDYHGPGRGSGNSLNALVDAYTLTRKEHYLAKAEEVIRRCIHPDDDCQKQGLDDVERHWSYLVFLQALAKYLECKEEKGEDDESYAYARASFLRYAEWMLENEVPYATVLHKVLIPTETWPAQDVRKSAIFHIAAKYSDGCLQARFTSRASFFFQTCVKDLLSFHTCVLTRPIALLLANAHVHSYFETHSEDAPQLTKRSIFGKRRQFSPQFAELYWLRERVANALRKRVAIGRFLKKGRLSLERYGG